jgi:hypothetical protein
MPDIILFEIKGHVPVNSIEHHIKLDGFQKTKNREVYAYGYPEREIDNEGKKIESVFKMPGTPMHGVILKGIEYDEHYSYPQDIIDTVMYRVIGESDHGFSGSPVFMLTPDSNGVVFAGVLAGRDEGLSKEYTYVVKPEFLWRMLVRIK